MKKTFVVLLVLLLAFFVTARADFSNLKIDGIPVEQVTALEAWAPHTLTFDTDEFSGQYAIYKRFVNGSVNGPVVGSSSMIGWSDSTTIRFAVTDEGPCTLRLRNEHETAWRDFSFDIAQGRTPDFTISGPAGAVLSQGFTLQGLPRGASVYASIPGVYHNTAQPVTGWDNNGVQTFRLDNRSGVATVWAVDHNANLVSNRITMNITAAGNLSVTNLMVNGTPVQDLTAVPVGNTVLSFTMDSHTDGMFYQIWCRDSFGNYLGPEIYNSIMNPVPQGSIAINVPARTAWIEVTISCTGAGYETVTYRQIISEDEIFIQNIRKNGQKTLSIAIEGDGVTQTADDYTVLSAVPYSIVVTGAGNGQVTLMTFNGQSWRSEPPEVSVNDRCVIGPCLTDFAYETQYIAVDDQNNYSDIIRFTVTTPHGALNDLSRVTVNGVPVRLDYAKLADTIYMLAGTQCRIGFDPLPHAELYYVSFWPSMDDPAETTYLPYEQVNGFTFTLGSIADPDASLDVGACAPGYEASGGVVWINVLPAESLILPAETRAIGSEAFSNTGAKCIVIPGGCTNVAPDAFANCPELQCILNESGVNISAPAGVTVYRGKLIR